MTSKHLAECGRRIIGSILYREERKEYKQLQYLKTSELTVWILDCSDDFALYPYAVHDGRYPVYCLAGIIISKKRLEFSDNMSIFVHG